MRKSYLGVATPNGLEVFVPDHGDAIRFLCRRAYRRQHAPAVCCWAVLTEGAAAEVERLLAHGDRAAALAVLGSRAEHFGSIPPDTL